MTDKEAVKPTPITEPSEPHPEQTGQTTQDASSNDQKDPQPTSEDEVQPNADILTEGSVRPKRPRIKPGDVPRKARY